MDTPIEGQRGHDVEPTTRSRDGSSVAQESQITGIMQVKVSASVIRRPVTTRRPSEPRGLVRASTGIMFIVGSASGEIDQDATQDAASRRWMRRFR